MAISSIMTLTHTVPYQLILVIYYYYYFRTKPYFGVEIVFLLLRHARFLSTYICNTSFFYLRMYGTIQCISVDHKYVQVPTYVSCKRSNNEIPTVSYSKGTVPVPTGTFTLEIFISVVRMPVHSSRIHTDILLIRTNKKKLKYATYRKVR